MRALEGREGMRTHPHMAIPARENDRKSQQATSLLDPLTQIVKRKPVRRDRNARVFSVADTQPGHLATQPICNASTSFNAAQVYVMPIC